jgi:hypothetical protein
MPSTAFRGRIRGNTDAALEREHGGNVDDFTALALGNKLPGDRLRKEED